MTRFLPTPRLAWLAFAGVGVALAALVLPGLLAPLLAFDVGLIVAAAVDLVWTLGRALDIRREAGAIFSIGRGNVVHLHLRNLRRTSVSITVRDDAVEDTTSGGLPVTTTVAPFVTTTVSYELIPTRRGVRAFGSVTTRGAGPLGLVVRQDRFAVAGAFDVYPDVHAARSLELLRRRGRKEGAVGSVRASGGDTEVERLRPYVAGDEARRIDWRATARRDEPIVRQLQAESEQNVVFAIDVGRAMRGETDGLSRVDRALNAAILAADVSLRNGDRAGLLAFDDAPRVYLPPKAGRAASRAITRAIYALEPSLAPTDFAAAMRMLRTKLPSRSLVILITHVLDDVAADALASAVRSLTPRHVALCLLMRDPDLDTLVDARGGARSDASTDRSALRDLDLYVRAAAAEQVQEREALVRRMRVAGALVLDARPGDVTPELVRSYLDVKARRLL